MLETEPCVTKFAAATAAVAITAAADADTRSPEPGMEIHKPMQAVAGSIEKSSEATSPAIAAGLTGVLPATEAGLEDNVQHE